MIDNLPPIRTVLAEHNLKAKKSLGQNFLLDLNLTSKIARQAGDLSQCDVLEIGPGPGGLTRGLLAEQARHVVVIEKDRRCIAALREIQNAFPQRVTVLEGDALLLNPLNHLKAPIKVVANLPYNVGTDLLVRWLTPKYWPPFWDSLTLMFQKEVAERIVAQVASRAYSRLSILAQWRAEAQIVMQLPPSVFTPPPKVSSAVVHLKALKKPRFEADAKTLEKTVAKAFNQRRKMLRSSLKGITLDLDDKLRAAGISSRERAERVSLEQYCTLSQLL